MAENELIVTAGLNFQASESLILAQLKKIQDDFNSNGGLQINCTVNNDSLKAIQSQLSSLKQTLNVDINASHIQQSISQATKVEPVKINVTAEINKGELQRQAKEIEKALSIQYPKGQTQQLRDELKAYLSNYQKAIASNDLSGMETAIEKIAEFAGSYRKEIEIVNEELKYQQDRTREILKEQEKLYITAEQYAALQREVSKDGRTATQVLNSSIGVGRWSTDITKFDPRNLPYWSKFATEVNNINPLKDAILNEGDIVQGINDLNAFLGKSVDMTSQYLKANEQTWVEWRDIVHDAVSVARGEGSSLSNEFVNLLGFEDIATTEKNVQAMAEGMRTIQALKEQYIADTNVKNVTADWTKTAEGDLTGFTVNVQKATGEVERFRYEIDELNQVNFLGSSGSDRGISQMFERATKSADSLERKMLNLKAAADDVSAPRPITSDESINKVSQAYNNATEAVQKLRTADASTFGELENQAKIAVDELNNVIKAARNADTAATKLRAKPIEVIKQEEAANLEKFVAQISNSAILKVDALVQGVDKLRDELNKIQPNDKQGLANYLDNVSKLDSEFKALDAQAKTVKSAISDLDKVLNNSQLNKNVQNPNVTSLFGDVTELKGLYTNLFNTIGSDRSADALKRTGTELLAMKSTLENIVNDATQLERNLRGTADAERQQHNYWQGRFEESIKGMTAENEELKKMRQYYADLENVAQTSLGTIKSSYEKIVSLNAKLTSGKLPETEANSIRKQIEEQEVLAIKARQKLETEGLYTEEIAKQINGIKSQAEAIINARNQQKASNEELAKSINTYEDGLKAIQNAYKAIADATKTLYSNKSPDIEKSYALADIAEQRDLLNIIQERLAAQGLIDSAINDEIKKGEILVTRTQQIAQSKAQEAQATRDERDAERELAEQARQHNKELKDTESYINKTVVALEKFNNSTVAKNNASNPAVASQTGLNADLINQLRGLQESLANDKSPENIARIIARMNELGGSLKDATARSVELNQSLKDNDASAKFSAKLNNLKNQVDIFANTNRRATESLRLMRDGETTFAQGFQNIRDALSSGNLDATDLQRLREQFQNFRGEADAAGLTVSRFFQSMQSQLRMVLQRWISLYAVIGYIRKMIDNVKELDNAMIDLRRVTNETDAGYQRFLEDANELARQMKTTTASLVEMSYQWSKLGFAMNEALELSKASTIFMRVADVGQDQALSNLVTSLKAFRLEASQTMDVVDKLDKLNNEYAVSAAGLGDGLERSASAMAMTGNSLEETLAMLTGAGEIVQNLENTGNALRVISLR